MLIFFAFLSLVLAQRVAELTIARRNARWMTAQGAVEAGQAHYKYLVALHICFFAALMTEVLMLGRKPPQWWMAPAAAFVVAQWLRYWCMTSLGPFWNTRIFVLPGAKAVKRGPYRFFRHPNYLAVITELLCIPLLFGAWMTAAMVSVVNLYLLSVRIHVEEAALTEATDYAEVYGSSR
ncbi:isoprenylcysteine carboxyl methyltransferase [Heliobacterium undosum]|uniref:Isoprenylcysteine carboxyl methyltransferase n=1 Tax=Heliomicrobium undosum TaxID=121734 RepID=A0A845KY47_9FIRM|nr:isoprenylcysteine carboxyl methyltransferase family protein [Heliomicrobium undosum]MZP28313.1 isoprenylcysteine carboxyl methyltransferase [Heliomicrobium undosum]